VPVTLNLVGETQGGIHGVKYETASISRSYALVSVNRIYWVFILNEIAWVINVRLETVYVLTVVHVVPSVEISTLTCGFCDVVAFLFQITFTLPPEVSKSPLVRVRASTSPLSLRVAKALSGTFKELLGLLTPV
jgi:hypothetical protein